jgi:hypothetical protein
VRSVVGASEAVRRTRLDATRDGVLQGRDQRRIYPSETSWRAIASVSGIHA